MVAGGARLSPTKSKQRMNSIKMRQNQEMQFRRLEEKTVQKQLKSVEKFSLDDQLRMKVYAKNSKCMVPKRELHYGALRFYRNKIKEEDEQRRSANLRGHLPGANMREADYLGPEDALINSGKEQHFHTEYNTPISTKHEVVSHQSQNERTSPFERSRRQDVKAENDDRGPTEGKGPGFTDRLPFKTEPDEMASHAPKRKNVVVKRKQHKKNKKASAKIDVTSRSSNSIVMKAKVNQSSSRITSRNTTQAEELQNMVWKDSSVQPIAANPKEESRRAHEDRFEPQPIYKKYQK